MNSNVDIAIVGMSCIFPGAADTAAFWNNITSNADAIQPIPSQRLAQAYTGTAPADMNRFYNSRGGFIDGLATFDPALFGMLPAMVEELDPAHLLALSLARTALEDAGFFEIDIPPKCTGLFLGNGSYSSPGAPRPMPVTSRGGMGDQGFVTDAAIGLFPNPEVSLIADKLNLEGPAYMIDASFASSLIAIDHGVKELSTGSCDVIVAGGLHLSRTTALWDFFIGRGMLSASHQMRPFDRRADGLVIGEGCGFVVLKRLDDAIRDGHRIYALIKGSGVSREGASDANLNSSAKSQSKAILQAWERAGLNPAEIGYIEANGIATRLGDSIELQTLAHVFPRIAADNGRRIKAGIGSVKSNIGHTMSASGIAGVIKTALALYHGQLPPTLHCEMPLEGLKATTFEPVQETIDWQTSGLARLAGVNAFGISGINAHVVLQAYGQPVSPRRKILPTNEQEASQRTGDQVLFLARPNKDELVEALENNEAVGGTGDYRVAVFDPTPERIQRAIKIVRRDRPWRNKQDIWFSNEALLGHGRIAFLFPGLDGLTAGETESIARYFDFPLLHNGVIFSPDRQTGEQHNARSVVLDSAVKLAARTRLLDAALKKCGIHPDINAGHSLGEWLAGFAAGWAKEEDATSLLQKQDPDIFEASDSPFLAVGCGYARLMSLLDPLEEIYLSTDNCPQQVIVCGTETAVGKLSARLQQEQIFYQLLPFRSGFHSPFLKERMQKVMKEFENIRIHKPRIPLWSATNLEEYPATREGILAVTRQHLLQPVRFRELTEKLYKEGVRAFIQVGSGGLIGFVDDTLKGQSYSAVAANIPGRPGLSQLQRVLAALFVEGRDVWPVFSPREKEKAPPVGSAIPLKLHFQPAMRPHPAETSPILHTLLENFREIEQIQSELISLFNQRQRNHQPGKALAASTHAAAAAVTRPIPVSQPAAVPQPAPAFSLPMDISLQSHPYLIDHSLIRQRPGHSDSSDMNPVIPMTMLLELLADMAESSFPGITVRKMMNVQVWQWMKVDTPFRTKVTGEWLAPGTLGMTIEKYAGLEIHSASGASVTPPAFDIGDALPFRLTSDHIYEEYMFHGPAYQGIRQVTKFAANGITGYIQGCTGKGSLLDNAGQLFGLWLQLTLPNEKVAFPVNIKEVEFYGDRHIQEGLFECTCRLTQLTEDFATADFFLKNSQGPWAVIRGWKNRRLEVDDRLWKVCTAPLRYTLSEEILPDIFLCQASYSKVLSWDFVTRRYFSAAEREFMSSLSPARKREWLISRVAAKDALREFFQRHDGLSYYPAELHISSDSKGRPVFEKNSSAEVHLSLSHKGTIAVAIAAAKPVGIDIETIIDRGDDFASNVLHPEELALLPAGDRSEWLTRCWTAKEAYGKSLGLGLQGTPLNYRISAIRGEDIYMGTTKVRTFNYKNYIIGWTH